MKWLALFVVPAAALILAGLELPELWRNRQRREAWIVILTLVLATTCNLLWVFGVHIPNPTDLIQRLFIRFFPL